MENDPGYSSEDVAAARAEGKANLDALSRPMDQDQDRVETIFASAGSRWTDLDGNGSVDEIRTTVQSILADGAKKETVAFAAVKDCVSRLTKNCTETTAANGPADRQTVGPECDQLGN